MKDVKAAATQLSPPSSPSFLRLILCSVTPFFPWVGSLLPDPALPTLIGIPGSAVFPGGASFLAGPGLSPQDLPC